MGPEAVQRARLAAQRLTETTRGTGAAEVVASCVGIQAQDLGAALLGIRARSRGLTDTTPAERAGIDAEAADIGRFLGTGTPAVAYP